MKQKSKGAPGIPGWAKVLITVVVLVGAAALIFTQLPRGAFSTDLSLIGQGKPVAVVARDISFVAGGEVMDLMNTVRHEYVDRMEFLVAHLGRPEGQAFARNYDAADGTLVVFSADGTPVTSVRAPRTDAELRRALDSAIYR
ncbi:hypothetical protein [Thioalkalivibrio paradoxus]|uniref:Uncharacterized protein n=1 Tax=Thioalkalivibrio paradoxus ARh 1 TaxID=713585 RepID=W0DN54_9GAMM|nr:hypothetical protein [Thioalkalivibrio paradoxus]AHF00030.1 hypothetical protein THITH_06925 [Thioalkalivibrio paradoxus ARh 1]